MNPIPILGFADPVSSWSHLLGAGIAFVGGFFLWHRGRGNAARMTSLMVFSFSLVFLFSMSGTFHMLEFGGTARDVLRRLDHAGIWLLIAGTFTPIHVILFRGGMRWAILLLIWVLAITGLVLEVVFFTSFPESLLLSFFLGLGWLGAVSGGHFMLRFRDPTIRLLAAGGIFYSIGAVIDFLHAPIIIPGYFGSHELFHIFVLAAALCHWFFIYHWCDHPVANRLIFNVYIHPDKRVVARAVKDAPVIEADSVESLKRVLPSFITEKYHSRLRPEITLRYVEEEDLKI